MFLFYQVFCIKILSRNGDDRASFIVLPTENKLLNYEKNAMYLYYLAKLTLCFLFFWYECADTDAIHNDIMRNNCLLMNKSGVFILNAKEKITTVLVCEFYGALYTSLGWLDKNTSKLYAAPSA